MKKIYLISSVLLSLLFKHFFWSLPSALWSIHGRLRFMQMLEDQTTSKNQQTNS